MSEFMPRKTTSLIPALLLCGAALSVAVAQFVFGVRLQGYKAAYDGAFAVAALSQFQNEVFNGDLLPRWVASGHGGLGSPVFFFYPPGSFALATALSAPFGLSPATTIGFMGILLRAAGLLGCAAWLRLRASSRVALTGGALYVLMPYVAVAHPQIRLAFAECASAVLVPVAFLALEFGNRRPRMLIPAVALAVAGLATVHLPMTVIAGGMLLIYAAASLDRWRDASVHLARVGLGILLGLGLAGFTIAPALALLPEISQAALWDPGHEPMNNFLLDFSHGHRSFFDLFLDISLLVPVLMPCLLAFACGPPKNFGRTLSAVFVFSIFLTLPISWVVWAVPSPLRYVQFPTRVVVVISLLGGDYCAPASKLFAYVPAFDIRGGFRAGGRVDRSRSSARRRHAVWRGAHERRPPKPRRQRLGIHADRAGSSRLVSLRAGGRKLPGTGAGIHLAMRTRTSRAGNISSGGNADDI